MKRLIVIAILLLSPPLLAKEGFSVTIGVGGGLWDIDQTVLNRILTQKARPPCPCHDGALLWDEVTDGLALRFSMTYNIMGYASIEAGVTAHGWNLSEGDAIGGSGHIGGVAHIHPFQFFMPERDFDATFFLGGSWSIIGGGHPGSNDDRGLDGGALELGFTGRYFPVPWLSFGGEIRFYFPFFNRWHIDWDDDVFADLDESPDAMFITFLFLTTFHFQVSN